MDSTPRDEGSFEELATDLLTDAYPDEDLSVLQREAASASNEVAKIDEISSELDRMASFAPASRHASADHSEDLNEDVQLAAKGDVSAVTRVLSWIYPMVLRYCRAGIGSTGSSTSFDADVVAQEVCIAVIGALPRYAEGGRSFSAFVYTIAAQKVVDKYRAAIRQRSRGPGASASELLREDIIQQATPTSNLIGEKITELLNHLPARQRDVVMMRVVMGLSAEETAHALESTPGAVRVTQHRALSKLRRVLDEQGRDPS